MKLTSCSIATYKPLLLALGIVTPLFSASPAMAGSILGDAFEISLDYVVAGGSSGSVGPFSGVASASMGDPELSPDASATFDIDGFELNLFARWIDADSIWFVLFGNAIEFDSLVFKATGLNFSDAGSPVAITGASLDPSASGDSGAFGGFDEVIEGRVLPPSLSFTANSVTMSFATFTGNLVADGPTMQVDLRTASASPVEAPEPGILNLGLLALAGGIVAARRRA